MSDHKNKNQNTYRGVSYNISDISSKNSSSLSEGVYRGVKYTLNNLKKNSSVVNRKFKKLNSIPKKKLMIITL